MKTNIYRGRSLEELTMHVDFSFLKVPRRQLKVRSKQAMAIKIFTRFYQLMIDDIIDNNVIFQAPIRYVFRFYISKLSDNFAKKLNVYDQTDIFKKDFKQYGIFLRWFSKVSPFTHRLVTVDNKRFKKIQENALTTSYLGGKMFKQS